jgi:hypothetical protein
VTPCGARGQHEPHHRPSDGVGQAGELTAQPAGLAPSVATYDRVRIHVELRPATDVPDDRLGREDSAANRRADALAAEVARQPGGVADEAEADACQPARRPAATPIPTLSTSSLGKYQP